MLREDEREAGKTRECTDKSVVHLPVSMIIIGLSGNIYCCTMLLYGMKINVSCINLTSSEDMVPMAGLPRLHQ